MADGDYTVGLHAGVAELEAVDEAVDGLVVFRLVQEDDVVEGDHGAAAGAAYAKGKLVAQAVVDVDLASAQFTGDCHSAP